MQSSTTKRNSRDYGTYARKGRPAFTILELLVVVSIIMLLLALLMPSLAGARKEAARAVCGGSGIKGTVLATKTYLTENNNCFPINGLLMPKSGVPLIHANDPKFTSKEVTDQQK